MHSKHNYTMLLGATKTHNLVFAEVEINHAGFQSVLYEIVKPVNEWDVDMEALAKVYIDSLDAESKYELCNTLDCTPEQLIEYYVDKAVADDFIDCSKNIDSVVVDKDLWIFELFQCGQFDLQDMMEVYTNEKLFNVVYNNWKEYDCKNLPAENLAEFENTFKGCLSIDEVEWVKQYIKENSVALRRASGKSLYALK